MKIIKSEVNGEIKYLPDSEKTDVSEGILYNCTEVKYIQYKFSISNGKFNIEYINIDDGIMGCYTECLKFIPPFPPHVDIVSVKDNNIAFLKYYDNKFILNLSMIENGDFLIDGSGIYVVPDRIRSCENKYVLDKSKKLIEKMIKNKSNKLIRKRISNLKSLKLKNNWIKSLLFYDKKS